MRGGSAEPPDDKVLRYPIWLLLCFNEGRLS